MLYASCIVHASSRLLIVCEWAFHWMLAAESWKRRARKLFPGDGAIKMIPDPEIPHSVRPQEHQAQVAT